MWFRRIIEVEEEEEEQSRKTMSGKPPDENGKTGDNGKTASTIEGTSYNEMIAKDEPSNFRRVSMITKWSPRTSRLMASYVESWNRGMTSGMSILQ
jgi:hypothetical protein